MIPFLTYYIKKILRL